MRQEAPVGPLERGLLVLEAVGRASAPPRPADLVTETGLARSTVDRLVSTLTATGHLRAQGRELVAAPRAMEPGNAYLSSLDPAGLLARRAAALADRLDESVSLAVQDGTAVRFTAQSPRRRSLSAAFKAGDLLPAERCAPGALFAAHWTDAQWRDWSARAGTRPFSLAPITEPGVPDLFRARAAQARAEGVATDDQLIEPGLIALAVPLPGLALSVVSHTSRHTLASLVDHVRDSVRECAADLTALLAAPAAPPSASAPGEAHDLKAELGAEFLQSLDRGLAVLAALGVPGGLTITEAAEATGQARATARRALLSLTALGYAAGEGRRFRPLPRVLDLGYRQVSALSLEELLRPHLRALVQRVRDSASVAVLDGTEIRYVARAQASRVMRVDLGVGTRLPAYATAMGRVLLAGLPPAEAAALIGRSRPRARTEHTRTSPAELREAVARARADGHSLVDQELEEGLASLSVPLHARGEVVAALNVAVPAGEDPAALRARLLPELAATARAIDTDLAAVTAHQPFPG